MKTEIKWAKNVPDYKFDNDPPPPGDDLDTSPGSLYDRTVKRIEERQKAKGEKK